MQDSLNEILHSDGCPVCGSQNVAPVTYTWWGGVIGPKILHHTKCKDCKHTYNRKTRQTNTKAIILYSVIIFVVMFAVTFWLKSR